MNRRMLSGVALVILLTLAACGSGEQAGETPAKAIATNTVEAVKSYRYSPADITVTAGSTVTWANNDNFVHNVHLLGSNETTEPLPIGGSASITFNDLGLIRYECSLHPAQMKGSIQVT